MTHQSPKTAHSPFYRDDWLTVYHGDCREVMAGMEPESVHCVVTSPPYWGLRDYGTPGQLGLEPTPERYVANLIAVFREVRRVLRKDGTVWLNLGDSYSSGGRNTRDPGLSKIHPALENWTAGRPDAGLTEKQLVGIPWRVAFALQADGWYLRSDIIWAKPNPMPESVTDRPTKSHEYIFLLSKSARYYFDADAVREPHKTWHDDGEQMVPSDRRRWTRKAAGSRAYEDPRPAGAHPAGRNIRSVWTMATQPYPGAHFATFPETLPERCIKAGTSEKGVCPECGAPWERVVERQDARVWKDGTATQGPYVSQTGPRYYGTRNGRPNGNALPTPEFTTTGWRPGCRCEHDGGGWVPAPAVVLDPFAGSGTTGMVAQSLSRRAVLIDLSLDYLDQLMARNADIPLGLTS